MSVRWASDEDACEKQRQLMGSKTTMMAAHTQKRNKTD
jgi:hypothetical protein